MSVSASTYPIEWFWTWSGKSFGYRNQDALYSYEGRQVGHFAEGDEIYGHDGDYIGEVRTNGRLITNVTKGKYRRPGFLPMVGRGFPQKTDTQSKDLPNGFRDFPAPTRFA